MKAGGQRRGQSLVEFALVAPILLLLLSGGGDLARVYFVGIQIADGARQAALYASDNPPTAGVSGSGYTTADLQAIAQDNSGNGSGFVSCPAASVTVTIGSTFADSNSGSGYYQPITVSCALPLLTPLLPSPVRISSTVEALVIPQ